MYTDRSEREKISTTEDIITDNIELSDSDHWLGNCILSVLLILGACGKQVETNRSRREAGTIMKRSPSTSK